MRFLSGWTADWNISGIHVECGKNRWIATSRLIEPSRSSEHVYTYIYRCIHILEAIAGSSRTKGIALTAGFFTTIYKPLGIGRRWENPSGTRAWRTRRGRAEPRTRLHLVFFSPDIYGTGVSPESDRTSHSLVGCARSAESRVCSVETPIGIYIYNAGLERTMTERY